MECGINYFKNWKRGCKCLMRKRHWIDRISKIMCYSDFRPHAKGRIHAHLLLSMCPSVRKEIWLITQTATKSWHNISLWRLNWSENAGIGLNLNGVTTESFTLFVKGKLDLNSNLNALFLVLQPRTLARGHRLHIELCVFWSSHPHATTPSIHESWMGSSPFVFYNLQ